MCFSAAASFGAGTLLGVTGLVALKKVTQPSQTLFAAVPVLFSVQQISEGILWLSLSQESQGAMTTVTTFIFLFFAQILWPIWIPLSMALIEQNKTRRKWIFFSTGAGVFTAVILAYRLLVYEVSSEIQSCHIYYDIDTTTFLKVASSICYFIAIVIPGFISSVPRMRILAVTLALSLGISKVFYESYLISVWCFFSAILSVTVIYVLSGIGIKSQTSIFQSSGKFKRVLPDHLDEEHFRL